MSGVRDNFIRPELLGVFMGLGWAGKSLAPFFAVHAKHAHDFDGGVWFWDSGRAVEETSASVWDMLAKWQALRAVKVDRRRFEGGIVAPVQRLSRLLDREGLCSLHDVADLDVRDRRRVLREIHAAVMDVSALKPTKAAEPMFGSKVLHHYFPSVVPVFDTAMVRRGVLRLHAFRAFAANGGREWHAFDDATEAGGSAAFEFDQYMAFCLAQLHGASSKALDGTRSAFAKDVRHFVPTGLWEDQESFVHALDAKVAEFCLLGQAKREGLIGS